MTAEDFTTYMEVDPNSHISKTANHVDFDAYRNEDAYVYKDKGAGYFTNFTHQIDVKCATGNGNTAYGFPYLLSVDTVDDVKGLQTAGKTCIGVQINAGTSAITMYLVEYYAGSGYASSAYNMAPSTWFYLKIVKNGTGGTLYIYSDLARTNLLATLTLTFHADHTFRYVFAANTYNDSGTYHADSDIENLDLQPAILKTITDSLGLSDAIYRNKPSVAVTDNVNANDSLRGNKSPLIVSDVATLSDVLLRHKSFTLTDTLVLADAILRDKPSLSIADAVALAETTLSDKSLKVLDSLGSVDAILRNKTFTLTDATALADAILRDKSLAITDSVGSSDNVLGNKSPLIVSDAVSLADLITVIIGATIKTVTDAIEMSDKALINRTALIADAVNLLDQVFRHKPAITVSDAIGAVEIVLVAKLLALGDSVNLADVAALLKTLNVSDTLTLIDTTSTPSRVLRALDSVGLADSALVNKVLQVTESISLVEAVKVGIGGVKKTRLFLILGDLAVQLTGE